MSSTTTDVSPRRFIDAKRHGTEHTPDELRGWITHWLAGDITDAQMSAWCMAGVLRGFSEAEAAALAGIFVDSGDVIDLGGVPEPRVDKHSTGGVGDTTTLVVAPLAAACGLHMAKLSGAGLGHTGGTTDKLEAIPGFRCAMDSDAFIRQATEVGCVVASATSTLVPADKRLYALRDVTGTVESTALIAASVMSKKIAAGADHIVLDVKFGDGAFMPTKESAEELARVCIAIGNQHGRNVSALVTDMSAPLGPAIGNSLEVAAACDVLSGKAGGPLAEVSVRLVAELLVLAGVHDDVDAAADTARGALSNGRAAERFEQMIAAQGGDAAVVATPREVLEAAPVVADVAATSTGTVQSIAARELGLLAVELGAGRPTPGAAIDPRVGITLSASIGDKVDAGTTIATIHAADQTSAQRVADAVGDAIAVSTAEVSPTEVVAATLR